MIGEDVVAKLRALVGSPAIDRALIPWIESQPVEFQASLTQMSIEDLSSQALLPRHASGNACIKLCYLIEQCKISKSADINSIAWSEKTCLDLFNLYVEWNEKNQNRSMKQVLDLISSLLARNPDRDICTAIKGEILRRFMSIIAHKTSQPLVKPALKCMECFVGKGIITLSEFVSAYLGANPHSQSVRSSADQETAAWDSIVADVFGWMAFPDIASAAGKFLVRLFRALKMKPENMDVGTSQTRSWQRWIRMALSKDPGMLESIRTNLFPTLFKLDRAGSQLFLEDLSKERSAMNLREHELDAQTVLAISAFEVGKKAGLVDMPDPVSDQSPSGKTAKVTRLREDFFQPLLCHANETVRSLAFSLLVSSLSPIRPFSSITLETLRSNLYFLHSESDARTRNEILSSSRHMVERLRGATAYLSREVKNSTDHLRELGKLSVVHDVHKNKLLEATQKLLEDHKAFVSWYSSFLLEELIPTASYQRHVSALKAMYTFLTSGILNSSISRDSKAPNETYWPITIDFFSQRAIYLLMDLLVNPFDDVRSTASSILKLASPQDFARLPVPQMPLGSAGNIIPLSANNQGNRSSNHNTRCMSTLDSACVTSSGFLDHFIRNIEAFSDHSGRADFADGVAHAYELLYYLQPRPEGKLQVVTQLIDSLDQRIVVAEKDLARAVKDTPVHGNFAALSYILANTTTDKASQLDSALHSNSSQLEIIRGLILQLCSRIWDVVRPILCSDSPEGHLPADLVNNEGIDTKDVLSYSFRAINDSSNLLCTLVTTLKPSSSQPDATQLTANFVARVGDLSFTQLSSLRHRGAFSTVALTFASCCRLAVQCENISEVASTNVLKAWYEGVMACIEVQVSTTRRSAGIPVLLTAIMAAMSNSEFDLAMKDLIARANRPVISTKIDDPALPQVHAMNGLREIFKSSATSTRVDSYLSECIQLVSKSLRSPRWAIINCSLLLLRSIIDVLLGTSDNQSAYALGRDGGGTKIQYEKYPSLVPVLMEFLQLGTHHKSGNISNQARLVLPALSIIRRAGPPPGHIDDIIQLVRGLLSSRSWHIRDDAAQTLAVMIVDKSVSVVGSLGDKIVSDRNESHGTLLAAEYVMKQRSAQGRITLEELAHDYHTLQQQEDSFYKLEVQNGIILTALSQPESSIREIAMLFGDGNTLSVLKARLSVLDGVKLVGATSYVIASIRQAVCLSYQEHMDSILQYCQTYADGKFLISALECIQAMMECGCHCIELGNLLTLYIEAAERSKTLDGKGLILSRCSTILRSFPPLNLEALYDLKPPVIRMARIYKALERAAHHATSSCKTILAYWVRLVSIDQKASSQAPQKQETHLHVWGDLMVKNINTDSEFDARDEAIDALTVFFSFIELSEVPDLAQLHGLLPALYAVYIGLTDDSDLIRRKSASVAAAIMGHDREPLCALATCQPYLTWIFDNFHTSKLLMSLVICRLTCGPLDLYEQGQEIGGFTSDQLAEAFRVKNALFVEEENNIYVDRSRELSNWKDIALRLRFSQDLDLRSLNLFEHLLDTASSGMMAIYTTQLKDGQEAYSWSSRPKAFFNALRYIFCAEVILKYVDSHTSTVQEGENHAAGNALPEEWTLKLANVEARLEECLKIGSNLHPMLLSALQEARR